jgi:hypothetical protein
MPDVMVPFAEFIVEMAPGGAGYLFGTIAYEVLEEVVLWALGAVTAGATAALAMADNGMLFARLTALFARNANSGENVVEAVTTLHKVVAASKRAEGTVDAAPIGTQNAITAWATKTGRAYDRRFRQFWRQLEGETIGDGIEVAHVNRKLAKGVQPDLVLIDRRKKLISIHDLTSKPNAAHLAKGESYVKYFKEKYPGFEIEYTEGYWSGKEDILEALTKSGIKYLPGDDKP